MERHAALSNAKEGQGNVMRGERHCGATSRPFAALRHGALATRLRRAALRGEAVCRPWNSPAMHR